MVELAWRVSRFQPQYRAVRQWGALIQNPKATAAARKKAIVALARRLSVDLWRIATGRVKAEELGLVKQKPRVCDNRKLPREAGCEASCTSAAEAKAEAGVRS